MERPESDRLCLCDAFRGMSHVRDKGKRASGEQAKSRRSPSRAVCDMHSHLPCNGALRCVSFSDCPGFTHHIRNFIIPFYYSEPTHLPMQTTHRTDFGVFEACRQDMCLYNGRESETENKRCVIQIQKSAPYVDRGRRCAKEPTDESDRSPNRSAGTWNLLPVCPFCHLSSGRCRATSLACS